MTSCTIHTVIQLNSWYYRISSHHRRYITNVQGHRSRVKVTA